MNLSYLAKVTITDAVCALMPVLYIYFLQDVYDKEYIKAVYQSPVVTYQDLKDNKVKYEGSVRITYHTKDIFKRTAKMLGLMDDFRVSINFENCIVDLAFLSTRW